MELASFSFKLLPTNRGGCQVLISSGNKLGLTCAKLRSVKALAVNWQYYLVKGGKIIFRKIISEVPNNVS